MISLLLLMPLLGPQDEPTRRPVPVEAPAPTSTGARLALYDVSALTGHAALAEVIAELTARSAEDSARPAQELFERLERVRSEVAANGTGVLESVRESLQPTLGEGQHLELLEGGHLALYGSAEQHAWLTGFLSGLRGFRGMFDVQAVLFLAPPDALPGGFRQRHREVLTAAASTDLLRELGERGIERVTSPRLLCLPFQRVSLTAGEEVAYLGDYEFTQLADREDIVPVPLIQTLHDGFALQLRNVPLAGGRVRLVTDVSYTRLQRPIASLLTSFGGQLEREVRVQLPETLQLRVNGDFDLSPGQSLLLVADDRDGEQTAIVLIRTTAVQSEPK